MTFRLRDFQPADTDAVIRINNAEIPAIGALTDTELKALASQAFYFRVVEPKAGENAGFLLALDQTAGYSSPNFLWFKARYPEFIYVDRIAVHAPFRAKGLGRMLYEDLERHMKGVSPLLACEVNLRPPNPVSLAFHRHIGFQEVGVQDTEAGKKTVPLLIKRLKTDANPRKCEPVC